MENKRYAITYEGYQIIISNFKEKWYAGIDTNDYDLNISLSAESDDEKEVIKKVKEKIDSKKEYLSKRIIIKGGGKNDTHTFR